MPRKKYTLELLKSISERDGAELIGEYNENDLGINSKIKYLCGKCKLEKNEKQFNGCFTHGLFCKTCIRIPKDILDSFASFSEPEKIDCWSDKNSLKPHQVAKKSNKKFKFDCKCGKEFCSSLNNISAGKWCPHCARLKYMEVCDTSKNEEGDITYPCKQCEQFKTVSEFAKNGTICNNCMYLKKKEYQKTKKGCILTIVQNTKASSKTRQRKSENKMNPITYEIINSLLKKQNNKCYISGYELLLETGDRNFYQMSPDRINEDVGYSEENVRLICLMFQTRATCKINLEWLTSLPNVQIHYNLIKDLPILDLNCEKVLGGNFKKPIKRSLELKNGKSQCSKCMDWKLIEFFNKEKRGVNGISSRCKDCVHKSRDNVRSQITSRINGAKDHSVTRQGWGHKNAKVELTIEEGIEIAKKQNFRCAITGAELCWLTKNSRDKESSSIRQIMYNQVASLDRIDDSNKVYSKDNCQWICQALNIPEKPTLEHIINSPSVIDYFNRNKHIL